MKNSRIVTIRLSLKSLTFSPEKIKYQNLPWIKPSSFDELESHGILAGTEANGNKVYVGRTLDKNGNYIPAKVIPASEKSFYVHNGVEESSDELEILDNVANCHWVKSDGRIMEDAAIVNGFYIGRALYNGNIVVGRVDTTSKELVGSFNGEVFSLPKFDVLIYKSKGVVYEAIQKASNFSKSSTSTLKIVNGLNFEREEVSTSNVMLEQENYINVVNRLRSLEMERTTFLNEKRSFDQRLEFEQKKVSDLSAIVRKLKIENAKFSKERVSFEGKFTFEQRKLEQTEHKMREYALNNSYLLKKLNSLEEAIRVEKLLVESMADKFQSSQIYNRTLQTRLSDLEEKTRLQQEKIFELESEIMVSSSNSETLLKRVSEYEETIRHLRIQLELFEKKLEISTNDNDYLVQRIAMLSQMLRNYQGQIECLTNKLQSSKTVISSAHAELARANSQVSKYQSALSGCYTLNGDLMAKVSGLNTAAQHQTSGECGFHLITLNSEFSVGSKSSSVYNKTSSLLEVSTDIGFEEIQAYGKAGMTNGESNATPYTVFQPEEYDPPPVPTPATAF